MHLPPALRQLMHRRIVMVAAIVLVVIAVLALGAPWVASFDPNDTAVLERLKGPSALHWLGTDELGRDLYARIVHGARYSLAIAAFTAVGAVLCGTVLGLVAGFFRQLDAPLMRLVDAMMSFPDILLAIALVAILAPSLANVVLALVLVYTPRVARVVRASTLVVRELLFVEAVRALGARTSRILWRHILPNLMSPILVQAQLHLRLRDPGRGRLVIPRRRRAARHPDLGHDGGRQPAVRAPRVLDRAVPGPRHRDHGAVAAVAWRRRARPAGPETEESAMSHTCRRGHHPGLT